jgi:DNA-directed RNA polymerase subunit RPC12/RpoP
MTNMKTKFCFRCGKDTPHNPMKRVPNQEPSYRCVDCGYPRRFGNAKNVLKVGGKVMWFAQGEITPG